MLWSQRRNSGAHGAENLIQISALAVLGPRTLAFRLPRTPPFSRLLRHAGSYSRTILTPNLQGLLLDYYYYFFFTRGRYDPSGDIIVIIEHYCLKDQASSSIAEGKVPRKATRLNLWMAIDRR